MSSSAPDANDELEHCLEQLARCCSAHKMPLFIAIQDAENSIRTVVNQEAHAKGDQFKLMRTLVKAGNLDQFVRLVSLDAQAEGHSSLFLKAIGIPEKPS